MSRHTKITERGWCFVLIFYKFNLIASRIPPGLGKMNSGLFFTSPAPEVCFGLGDSFGSIRPTSFVPPIRLQNAANPPEKKHRGLHFRRWSLDIGHILDVGGFILGPVWWSRRVLAVKCVLAGVWNGPRANLAINTPFHGLPFDAKLASKIQPKSIKNRCQNRSKNRCLSRWILEAFLLDFERMEASWHQNQSKINVDCEMRFFEKSCSRCSGGSIFQVLGVEVGTKNRSKTDQKMQSTWEGILASIFHRFSWIFGANLEPCWLPKTIQKVINFDVNF